jgi:hypothetical protein
VQVTDVERQANFILRGEIHRIQANLYQVWVILHPRGSGMHLAGMDTAAYIRSQPAGSRPGKRSVAGQTVDMRPAIARMELVRRANSDGHEAVCGSGQRGCPVLEVDVEHADQVFVVAHGNRDGISRLSGACTGSDPAQAQPGRFFYRYPEARFTSSDWPTVYAIAVSGAGPQQQLRQLLQEVPDACDNTGKRFSDAGSREQWLDRLDRFVATHGDHAVWTARRLP